MREFLNVLSYTFAENVKKKSFIISTIILLIITVGALSIPAIINYFDNGGKAGVENSTDKNNTEPENKDTIYIIDEKGILKNDYLKLSKVYPNYQIKRETADKLDSLKKEAKEGKAAIIVMDEKDGEPYFDYWVKSMGNMPDASYLSRALQDIRTDLVLKEAGVSDNVKENAVKPVMYNYNELGKSGIAGYFSAFTVQILIFFAIYFYGYGVAMSVASEKTSRVMEILITSTKPSRIVLGKSAAMGLLGLCQFLLIIFRGCNI
jgi:ABC-2 type transport system permease protein